MNQILVSGNCFYHHDLARRDSRVRLIGAGQAVPDARLGGEDLPLAEALGVAEARDREQALAALGPR